MAAWLVGILLLAPDLGADLQRALEASKVSRSGLSVVVGRAGEAPLYALAADASRIPASNQKVLTAAAAVHLLGADFRFQTVVARAGRDLVVKGDGDPNLSGRFFQGDPVAMLRSLAADVKKRAAGSIRNLILDASRFDQVYVHPDWPKDQLQRWYCAPVAALVYNDSCWDVTVRPGPAGGLAQVTVQPSLFRPRIDNRCRTGKQQVIHMGWGRDGGLEVRGSVKSGFTGQVTVREPVLFFGQAFLAALKREGVAITGRLLTGTAKHSEPIVVYRSALERTLPVMLGRSQNLYAECLFKRLGDGTFEGGGRAVLSALEKMGIETKGVVPKDGSGLARTNRLTARALYGCLQALRDEPVFVKALASGGLGTLRRRYRELDGRIRAKTGTIRGVSTLSGYVTGKSGRRYVFVVVANGRSVALARRLQDLIVRAMDRA